MQDIIKTLNTKDIRINTEEDFEKLRELALFQEKLLDLQEEYHKMRKQFHGSKKIVDMPEYMRNYYHTKEKFKVRPNFVCEACKCEVKYHSKAIHLASKKHKNATKEN